MSTKYIYKPEFLGTYSQGFAVNTVAVGTDFAVGKTNGILIILIDTDKIPHVQNRPVGIYRFTEPFQFPTDKDIIQTKTVKLPYRKDLIDVDVLLIKQGDTIFLSAILKEIKHKYQKVEVFLLEDVKVYD